MYARFNVMSSNLKWKFELFPKALPHYLPIALTAAADFGNTIQSKFYNISSCSMLGPQYITRKLLAYGYFPCHCHLIYIYWYVSPVTLPHGSFMGSHQVAGDTSTQECDNTGVQFTAITWQDTQIHRLMRTSEFNYKIWMWKYCALMLLDLSMESNVNEDNTTAQHFIVKILYVAKLCNSNYNRYSDSNTTAFHCDNIAKWYLKMK